MKEFVELVHKCLHLRTAHSELVGFWTAELGSMNKAVHVWKYGMLSGSGCQQAGMLRLPSGYRLLSVALTMSTKDEKIPTIVQRWSVGLITVILESGLSSE